MRGLRGCGGLAGAGNGNSRAHVFVIMYVCVRMCVCTQLVSYRKRAMSLEEYPSSSADGALSLDIVLVSISRASASMQTT